MSLLDLGLALAQPLTAQLHRAVPGSRPPADGAFARWGPLLLTSARFAARVDDAMPRPAVWAARAGFLASSLWNVNAQLRGPGGASVALMATAAASTSYAFVRLVDENDARADLLAPLAGWLTVATAANAQAAWKLPALPLVAGALAAAAIVLARTRGNRAYASAVLWRLGGVAWRALKPQSAW